ncbi:unnamed protein product [Boreogadus saida]
MDSTSRGHISLLTGVPSDQIGFPHWFSSRAAMMVQAEAELFRSLAEGIIALQLCFDELSCETDRPGKKGI